MSALLLLVVAATGGLVIARAVFFHRPDAFVLGGPAILAACWAMVIGLCVGLDLTFSDLWLPFWSVTGAACILGAVLIAGQPARMTALIAPTLASLTVMAPYVVHGFAEFPGSSFWDGFTYMAAGDTLWHFPRDGEIESASPFYQFGHAMVRSRFISAGLIGIFKGAFPVNGDTQAAVGYFLLFCVFTFACSTALLAQTILPDQRRAQNWFVVVATVSGSLINLIWANNFDHLLAFSLSPALLALALDLDRPAKAAAAGLLTAAEILIYQELCALLILPAALVALQTAVTKPSLRAFVTISIVAIVVVALITPLWSSLFVIFKVQFAGVFISASAAADKAGSGLFPSFLQWWCAPAAAFGFFKPEAVCRLSVESFYYVILGGACIAVLFSGLLKLRREPAIAISCLMFAAAITYFVVRRYDYGAYKVAEAAWIPMLTVGAIALARSPGTIRRTVPFLAAALIFVGVIRITAFESKNKVKTLAEYSALASLPKDKITAMRLSNPFAFQWASYYLRDHTTVIGAGRFMYFESLAPDVEPALSKLRAASYLVTDRSAPSVGRLVWSNSIYAVYKLDGETSEPLGE
jgi:hypothetical protein